MNSEFDPAQVRQLAEEAKAGTNFDWESLYEACGEPGEPVPMDKLAAALHLILGWMIRPMESKGVRTEKQLELVGRRAMAMLWVIGAGSVADVEGGEGSCKGLSLTKFAARFGVHKACMSELTADFAREFGIRNKAQGHGWNFKDAGASANAPDGAAD